MVKEDKTSKTTSIRASQKILQQDYFLLFDRAPVAYFSISLSGKILHANQIAKNMFGDNVGIQVFTQLILKQDQEVFQKFCHRLHSIGGIQTCQLTVLKVDGSKTLAILFVRAVKNASDVHTLQIVLTDVTEMQNATEKRDDSESHLRAILDTTLDAVIGLDEQGRITEWNARAEIIFGWKKDEALGLFLHETIIPPRYRVAHQIGLEKFLAEGTEHILNRRIEFTAMRKDGEEFPVELAITLLKTGDVVRFTAFIVDITERVKTEKKLRLAASVFTHSREGIMITAADGTIIDVNEAFSRITGYSRDEVLGKNPKILSSGRQEKDFYKDLFQHLKEEGHWYGEVWNRRKSGEVYAEMQTISAVHDTKGNIQKFVSLFSDITAIKEHEQQLEKIAHFDALTGLPNRLLLGDRLQQAMNQVRRHGGNLAVAFLDLDGFKAVNDQYGHDAGDKLLVAVADRMKHALREGDTIARIGGDEFVVIMNDLEKVDDSVPMLTRFLAAAAEPVHVGKNVLQVSASLGVTFYSKAIDADADQLLHQADQAMYQAKFSGKNRYHIYVEKSERET